MRAALADCLRIVASPGFLARIGAILAAGAAAGLLLLVLADSLVSMPAIGARLAEARDRAELGDAEGMTRAVGFEMSRFSECIGLSVAASGVPGEPAFSIRSRAVLWQPGQNICEAAFLASRRPDAVAWFDYSRYWHGYRIVVFPLVEALGLRGAGLVLGALAIASCAAYFVAMLPHAGPGALAGFLAAMAMTGLPFAALTPTHAISLAALFAGATLFALASKRLGRQGTLLLAFALGCAYNYLDFFYNPGAFAMLLGGTVVVAAIRARGALRPAALDAAIIGLSCLAGYLGFWAMKWLLALPYAYLASGVDPVRAGDFLRWAGGGEGDYRPFAASLHLVATTLNHPAKLALFSAALIGILAGLVAAGRRLAPGLAAMAAPVLVGFAAVEGAAAHSIAHAPFTFRIVPLALALGLLATGAALSPAAGRTRRRQGRRDDCAAPAASGRAPPARLRAAT